MSVIFVVRCEACTGNWPVAADLPKPPTIYSSGMMMAAGLFLANPELVEKFGYFVLLTLPTDAELLPKMKNLLKHMHNKGLRMNQLYIRLQECIKNFYRTQGNCNFFNGSKDLLSGDKQFDVRDAMATLSERMESWKACQQQHQGFQVTFTT